jgi:hypothetical protein
MIYGYVRVSNQDQNVESQKNVISRYGVDHKMMVDEWIEVEMSSRKSTKERRIDSSSRQATPPLILLGLKKYFSQTFQEIE